MVDDSSQRPPLDKRAFRDALGAFATGITVISCRSPGGDPNGVTVNSFSSLSLDPPLVLFCLGRDAVSWPAFTSARHFAVNVLSRAQEALSNRFADPAGASWEGVVHETWETGCPILAGAAASFECECRHRYDGGDHVIVVGEVKRMAFDASRQPLIYWRGRYAGLGEG